MSDRVSRASVRIEDILKQKDACIHMTGICGIGMAGLAFLLKSMGMRVSGCDCACNNLAGWLSRHGIAIEPEHSPHHVDVNLDMVVRSSAVSATSSEIARATDLGIPVYRRGEVLAAFVKDFFSVCVCGTHGKTTSASMLAQMLIAAGRSPWFCVGGECAGLPGLAAQGSERVIVVEADESDRTLELFYPDIALVTNIEFDHAECFRDLDDLKTCYNRVAANTRRRVIYCKDDPGCRDVCEGLKTALSYGVSDESDYVLGDIDLQPMLSCFSLTAPGGESFEVRIRAPGMHNVLNAAGVCVAGIETGMPPGTCAESVSRFVPVRRRFEVVLDSPDLVVVNDYAHHPTEIECTLNCCAGLDRGRTVAVFQPHRYTRTKALGREIATVLCRADMTILLPVYAASESVTSGSTSIELYEAMRSSGRQNVVYDPELGGLWRRVRKFLRAGDTLAVIGAGSVDSVARDARRYCAGDVGTLLKLGNELAEDLGKVGLEHSVIRPKEPLGPLTTIGVGGSADVLVEAGDIEDIRKILEWCGSEDVPWQLLGAGSNTLVCDSGAEGVVIRLGTEFSGIRIEDDLMICGARTPLSAITACCVERGLGGLEFYHGIPGSVGGALRMNAGAGGCDTGSVTAWARVCDPEGHEVLIRGEELDFSYRDCPRLANMIVLEAAFRIKRAPVTEVKKRIDRIDQKRGWMRGLRCAGSMFRNPEGDYAGRLLEQCGAGEMQVGGARVSKKHANIVVAERDANASDVLVLMEKMRNAVKAKTGVDLEPEVVMVR